MNHRVLVLGVRPPLLYSVKVCGIAFPQSSKLDSEKYLKVCYLEDFIGKKISNGELALITMHFVG